MGLATGSLAGSAAGSLVGLAMGSSVGLAAGSSVGLAAGSLVGLAVGSSVGLAMGSLVGLATGSLVGLGWGSGLGLAVGSLVGLAAGSLVGLAVQGMDAWPRRRWEGICGKTTHSTRCVQCCLSPEQATENDRSGRLPGGGATNSPLASGSRRARDPARCRVADCGSCPPCT